MACCSFGQGWGVLCAFFCFFYEFRYLPGRPFWIAYFEFFIEIFLIFVRRLLDLTISIEKSCILLHFVFIAKDKKTKLLKQASAKHQDIFLHTRSARKLWRKQDSKARHTLQISKKHGKCNEMPMKAEKCFRLYLRFESATFYWPVGRRLINWATVTKLYTLLK